jgi:hypothetical protein
MIVAWLLFPLVLLAVCLGCGLGVERVAGWQLPGGLLPSVGLALVIFAASLSTDWARTAPLTTAFVVALAVAGYVSSRERLRTLRPERWALAVGFGVFAVCAAPVVLSGNATFLGYFLLNDTAIHFSLIDQLLAHGHDFAGVAPSTFSSFVHDYLSTSYPTGADVALGAIRPLVGQDVAWIFQPYLAVILALGAVAIHELLRGVVRSAPLRATCAFIAAQAGLVYAFYLEASIKETATTWIITVTVVLVVATLRQRFGVRRMAPLLVAALAGLDVLDLAIVPWIGPPLAVFVAVEAWRARRVVRGMAKRRLALMIGGGVVLIAALAAPIIGRASTFFSVASSVLTEKNDLGNLAGPLQKWQILGIWPVGDFRYAVTTHYRLTYAVIGVAIASAVLGTLWSIRRRAFAPLLLLAGNGLAAAYLLSRASPYASAKVMMIFSLTAALMAMLGGAALYEGGRRIEGWALAAVIGGGVLWTNALAYHDASVAPRARFAELASIGSRFAGRGPAFYNLSDEFAIHFLRNEAPADPAITLPVLRPGLGTPTLSGRMPWDPDDLAFGYLQSFRLLVFARSPTVSRPPADYRLAYQGQYYDVWQRTSTPQVLEHIPLGSGLYPVSVPPCQLVMATAARAASFNARLAYVARPRPPTLIPTQATHPPDWAPAGDAPVLIIGQHSGTVAGSVRVAAPGRYEVWLEGSFSQSLDVSVDGRRVGSVANDLGPPGQYVRVGEVTLGSGNARVVVAHRSNDLAPGDAGTGRLVGPVMLVREGQPTTVAEIEPQRARSLCGRLLDWIEIVR